MKVTNKYDINPVLATILTRDDMYSGTGEKRDYSVTEILDPPKYVWLKRRHYDEAEEDVVDRIYRLLGTAMHTMLERASDTDATYTIVSIVRDFFGWINDQRLANPDAQFDGDELARKLIERLSIGKDGKNLSALLLDVGSDRYITERRFKHMTRANKVLSGGVDLIDLHDGTLYDFKLTSIWTWIYRNRPGSRTENFTEQTNIYRYMLEKAGYEINDIKITMVFRDHQLSAMERDSSYPRPIETYNVPLLGIDVVEELIEHRINELEKYRDVADDAIPPCPAADRWEDKTMWAVMKGTNKRASKVCYSYSDAQKWIENKSASLAHAAVNKAPTTTYEHQYAKNIAQFNIEQRPGTPKRCVSYCNFNKWCSFYKKYMMGAGHV